MLSRGVSGASLPAWTNARFVAQWSMAAVMLALKRDADDRSWNWMSTGLQKPTPPPPVGQGAIGKPYVVLCCFMLLL